MGLYDYLPAEAWELPVRCEFCGSWGPHRVILFNVQDKDHSLVECTCGLRFFEPRIEKRYLVNLMANDEAGRAEAECCCRKGVLTEPEAKRTTPAEAIAFRKAYYTGLWRRYKAFQPSLAAPRVFEVGGSVGWFSRMCLDGGADPVASKGCEFNRHACRLAKEEMGLRFWPGLFEDYPVSPGEEYDFLIAMDIIEHTYTPHTDLRKLRSLAAPNGHLVLKTFCDDLDEPLGRTMLLPPCHSYHFTQAALRRAVESAGWRILDWEIAREQVTVWARV